MGEALSAGAAEQNRGKVEMEVLHVSAAAL